MRRRTVLERFVSSGVVIAVLLALAAAGVSTAASSTPRDLGQGKSGTNNGLKDLLACVPASSNDPEPWKWHSQLLNSFPRDVPRPTWVGSYGDDRQLYQLDLWRDAKGIFGEFRNPVLEADSPTSRLYDVQFDTVSGALEFRVQVPVENTRFSGTLHGDSVAGTLRYRDVTEAVEWRRRPDISPPTGPDDLYWSRAQLDCAMTLWHRY